MNKSNTNASLPSLADVEKVHELLAGYTISSAIYVAAKLGISDLLISHPKTCEEMANTLKLESKNLYRLLRALASVGIYHEPEPSLFELTPLGATLRSDLPNSMRNLVIMNGSIWHWNTWGNLLHTITTGKSSFEKCFGMGFYRYMEKNPEVSKEFHAAMASLSSLSNIALVSSYDFSDCISVMDIGGGHGGLLMAIMKKYPLIKGVLLDIPVVIEKATELFSESGLLERSELIGGDFLKGINKKSDLYILKHVLHGMNDSLSVEVLKIIAKNMGSKNKLLIVEMMMPDLNIASYSKLNDLEMMLMSGIGRERTQQELENILNEANIKITNIIPIQMGVHILECRKN